LASLIGLIILAAIRADIVLLYLKNAYQRRLTTPRSMMPTRPTRWSSIRRFAEIATVLGLLAASMEMAAGLAVWEARKIVVADRDAVSVRRSV